MVAILQGITHIGKDKKNEQQGFTFRGIDQVMNELHGLFSKHQVFVTSKVIWGSREDRQTRSGGNLIYSIIDVEFTFYAIDGSSVSSTTRGEAMDSADKATNKAMSVALKYALLQAFMIPTEEMKDPDATTPETKPRITAATTAKPELAPEAFEKCKEAAAYFQETGFEAKRKQVQNVLAKFNMPDDWFYQLESAIK
jgi:hypothetical protein